MPNNCGFTMWGPYLSYGENSSTEMRISWETEHYIFNRKLNYGRNKDCSIVEELEYKSPQKHHCVILTDLKPQTKYYYKISTGNRARDDEIHHFWTGPTYGNTMSDSKPEDAQIDSKFDYEFCVL
ncbi:MAG: hypothetical protein GF364_05900 [Candidatus Lokiarchaeota archaeon]|nr:hypothetical protein [Candidatus Lokiarchaeota archaeon]